MAEVTADRDQRYSTFKTAAELKEMIEADLNGTASDALLGKENKAHKDRRVASTDRLCYSITENNCTSSSSQAQRRCLHTTVNCIICVFLHERIHGCGCIRSC